MRFIHIADVHLGMQPDAGFPWSEERGEAIWESFRRIIRLAGREKTDFLLIAGAVSYTHLTLPTILRV